MSETSAIEAAGKRLSLALEALEAAIDRRDVIGRDRETLAAQLQALGADSAQGFWFSRPVDAPGFAELLAARKAFPLPMPPAPEPALARR